MIDQVTEGVEVPGTKPEAEQQAVRREAKVTVRLPVDALERLDEEARKMRVPTSTWAAKVLTAKARMAPQPVRHHRAMIQKAFKQVRGLATNVNQMARQMNRGVFTGDAYAPTKLELVRVSEGISAARADLRRFASGLYALEEVRKNDE
ncbi:plasmid mobilization relaxosome protein MobC [Roseobacter weihaiensis]|uniref:plasmid mobilization relaxosome protein MobC n=1 Tax=Roseobacter weihaiensis TaxID=2763262 RepID=UPI001D0ADCBE|nr:plasmid mobilization relaxosome protein MobC [Roseobacter sp. H9]